MGRIDWPGDCSRTSGTACPRPAGAHGVCLLSARGRSPPRAPSTALCEPMFVTSDRPRACCECRNRGESRRGVAGARGTTRPLGLARRDRPAASRVHGLEYQVALFFARDGHLVASAACRRRRTDGGGRETCESTRRSGSTRVSLQAAACSLQAAACATVYSLQATVRERGSGARSGGA